MGATTDLVTDLERAHLTARAAATASGVEVREVSDLDGLEAVHA